MKRQAFAVSAMVLLGWAAWASGATIQVGPTRTYTTVAAGYAAASAGDTIEIDSGTYYQGAGWVYVNGKSNVTFRGVGATRPIIDAGNSLYRDKGIFVIEIGTNNITIENLDIGNSRMNIGAGGNAAGVRAQGTGLTLRNCYIHDCDNGVLNGSGVMLFEYCEFNHNGEGDGYSHNMYIGNADSFTLRYSYVHHGYCGQEVKSRAKVNYILYNRITNQDGFGNYEIDLSNGGTTYIIGNLIHQGPDTTNSGIITYAPEGASNPDTHLYVVNNTIVNNRGAGTFVNNYTSTAALLQNNIFQGTGTVLIGPATQTTNWITNNAYLKSQATYDYHLTASSTGAINAGTTPGLSFNGYALTPVYQYVHPYSYEVRPTNGTIDIGAYEYFVNQPPTVNAGPDQNVYEGRPVSLHATASDPDSDPLTYAWTQPAGLNVALSGAATADASFTAPLVATKTQAAMTFTVTVGDGKGGIASDSVNIRVRILGDISQDDSVDAADLLILASAWGSASGGASYNALCNLNTDATVDVVDLLILADNWTRTLP